MSENIGYATLSIIPSARGFGAALTKDVAPQMGAAGAAGGTSLLTSLKKAMPIAAVLGAVGVLAAIGSTFHDMTSTIRVGTGATGKALDGLVASAKKVGQGTAASFEDVGKTVTALNVRLGLTGPVLETLSKQFLAAGRITKQALDLSTVTGSFNAFGIAGADMSGALDQLFQISQATGMGINELAAAATKGAPAFRQFGLSFADSAALVGVLDKAGINSGKTIMALTIGLTKFAKEGKAPGPALRETVKSIEAFTKSGNDAKAIALAAGIFGTRGAAQFVAAVKSGKVNLDDMMKASGASSDTILKAADAVSSFSGKWLKFRNNVLVMVEPVATRVFKAFSDGMQFMSNVGVPALQKFGSALSAKVSPALVAFGVFVTGTLIPGVHALVAAFQAGGSDITSSGFAGGMERIGLAARAMTDYFVSNVIPAFISIGAAALSVVAFFKSHESATKALGITVGAVLAVTAAAWVAQGVVATANSIKEVVAWFTTATAATTSATIQSRSTAQIVVGWLAAGAGAVGNAALVVAGWVATAAAAISSAVAQVAAWVSTRGPAIGSALITTGALIGIGGWWLKTAIQATGAALAQVAAWVSTQATAIAGAAKAAVSLAIVAASWVAAAASATASGIAMAAAWVVGLGPVAWVIAGIAALVAAIAWVAAKTTWFQTVWEYTWGAIKVAFTATVNHFKAQFTDFVRVFGGIQDRIKGAFSGAGSWLYNAGSALLGGLWDGMKAKWDWLAGKVSSVAGMVKGFFGGSPVEYGPLLGWNNGGVGKNLVEMLAYGLSDTTPVDSAMAKLTGAMSVSSLVATPNIASPDFGSGAYANGNAGAGGQNIYVQNPFTGEYLLAQVAGVAGGVVARAQTSRTLAMAGGSR